MYMPAHFEETRRPVMQRLIAEHPLGTLVTLGPDGLTADHIPFLFDPEAGPHGTLVGHVARSNELWQRHDPATEVLVVFQGESAYISPNWYPTKRQTHQVVPTYNYAVVHAHGPLRVHHDAKWLRGVVGRLTKVMEATQPVPWKPGDAPADFIAAMLANIVGIEIPLSRLIGKWKVSQNRPPADREGAVSGLRATGHPSALAMADLIQVAMSPA